MNNSTSVGEGINKHTNHTELTNAFQYVVYPSVYFVIFTVGTLTNGALLLMFSKNKSVRTPPNIMVFNLVLGDAMNIYINAPLFYLSKYHSELLYLGGHGCRLFVIFRFLNHSVIELSILALSVQRFIATNSTFTSAKSVCRISGYMRTFFYILLIWTFALLLSLPCVVFFEFHNRICFPIAKNESISAILDIFYFVFYCFVIPVPLFTLNILTARRLRKSVRMMPGENRNINCVKNRTRTAGIVNALSFAYAFSHIPRSIWFFLLSYLDLDRKETVFMIIDEITNYLMFSHSILNPIALYTSSSLFRNLFNRYLFCCFLRYKGKTDSLCVHSQETQS